MRGTALPRTLPGTLPGAEPSTLPRGIGAMTSSFALLVLVDMLTLWPLLGYFYTRRAVAVLFPGGVPAALRFEYGFYLPFGYGAILGLALVFGVLLFGLALLDGRVPIAVAGFRLMSWGVVVLHPVLVAVIVMQVYGGQVHAGHPALPWQASPGMVVAVAATPLLYFLARPLLSMRWLDLRAPPESWEKLRGIDGTGGRTIEERGGRRSGFAATVLLTPYACWRAKMYVRMVIAAMLYGAALALVFVAPFRALIAIVANGAIARTVLAAPVRPSADRSALSPTERAALLRRIFTPDRLVLPPRFLAAGIVGVLILTPLDLEAAWYAAHIGGAPTLPALLDMSQIWPALLPFASMLLAVPVGLMLPLGNGFGIWWYRVAGGLLVVLHGLLLLFFWRLTSGPFGTPPPGVATLLRPVGIVLLALTPLAAAILASLGGAGKIAVVGGGDGLQPAV